MKQIALLKEKNGRIVDFAEIVEIKNDSELKRYEILRDTAKNEKTEIYEKDKFFIVYNYYMNRFLLQAISIDNEEKFFDLGEKVIKNDISVLEALTTYDFLLRTYKKLFLGDK